jgi:GPH family glycoside/pentoside/hexuronide:cation symporter
MDNSMPQRRLQLWQTMVYGLGVFGGMAAGAMNSLSLPIFNITLGVNVAKISLAMGIVQITGILLDPVIAYFSDNLRSRWGRRRPLIVAGSVIAGLTFAALWLFPSGWSGQAYFIWYLVMSLILNVGNSIYSSAYYALGIEASVDYKDRTRIMAVRCYFSKAIALINPWLFPLAQLALFGGALQGIRWIGALIGSVIIAGAIPCALFVPERFRHGAEPGQTAAPGLFDPILNFFKTIVSIGNNRYFWMCLGTTIALSCGLMIFEQIGYYVNIYYVFEGNIQTGAQFAASANSLGVMLAVLAVPLAQILCNRLGKHITLRLALGWMMAGSILKWWCYSPEHPWLIFVIPFFYSVGISSFWMVLPAMQADVVDIDELLSCKRREAMFGAVTNLGMRVSAAVSMALMGFTLNATGFVRELGGEQLPETFTKMRLLYSFAMAAVLFLSLLFIARYDLTAQRMEEVRAELEQRGAGQQKGKT